MVLDREIENPRPVLDLDRIIGAPETGSTPTDLPLFPPAADDVQRPSVVARRSESAGRSRSVAPDDAPLITVPARPRTPLGVRRATPEVPRARPRTMRPAGDTLFETPPAAVMGKGYQTVSAAQGTDEPLAAPSSRIAAALVDALLLSLLDGVVLYFTLRLCGRAPSEILQLPLLPLAAFFLLLNGGYFVAFTTVGGQSIGKMALGIKVIGQEEGSIPVGRATVRTLAYLISALPLGAGFLPGVMSADRLALHDRLAHTRVVRPTSA